MPAISQLSASYRDCAFTATLNGVPITAGNSDGDGDGFLSTPLNAFLRGPDNLLRIEFSRRGPEAEWSGRVEALAAGDIVDSADAGDIALPATGEVIEHRFASDVDLLSPLLAAAVPSDAETVTAFARSLCEQLQRGEVEAALEACRPKFTALAEAYGHPLDAVLKQVGQMLGSFRDRELAIDRISPQPCCGDRLWVLLDDQDRPLLRVEDDDGGVFTLEAIAAVLPDGPAVVR